MPEYYTRKQTLTNAERYITPKLKELEDMILGAEDKLFALEYDLFCQVREELAAQIPRIQETAKAIAQLDVYASLSVVAQRNNYVRPTVNTKGVIDIKNGRHPVVEKMINNDMFIANDTYLDNGSKRVSVITGPNMAGKSTYMRQTALIVLMAQIGSFVPAEKAKIGPGDLVLEVGPGIGTLTQALAETGADVKSVEIDESLLPILRKTLEGYDNVEIIHGDILKVDLKDITGGKPFTVAANLPYYITTPIIFSLLEANLPLKRIVVMVQKEVAERMAAHPGTKAYGPLSLALQYYSEPQLAIPVPAHDFMPAPKVDSMVVVCEKRESPIVNVDASLYVKVVRAAFSQRRKMLRTCLKSMVRPGDTAEAWMARAGIEPTRRGESLTIEEFGKLAESWEEK